MAIRVKYGVFFIFLVLILGSTQVSAADLHIAVASNFKSTLQSVIQFLKQNPESAGMEIIVSSGSSGVLYAQIKKGAPFDVFLSADELLPDLLIKENLALSSSREIYARGQVALLRLVSTNIPIDLHVEFNRKQRYAMANPKLAPYGMAAKSLMQGAGLWHEKDSQRIMAQNIAGAFQYLASGAVKLGWVALSQLKLWQNKHPSEEHDIWIPELNDYPPIYQVGVVLKGAKHPKNAEVFMEKLSAPYVQTLIKSQGYQIPTDPN